MSETYREPEDNDRRYVAAKLLNIAQPLHRSNVPAFHLGGFGTNPLKASE